LARYLGNGRLVDWSDFFPGFNPFVNANVKHRKWLNDKYLLITLLLLILGQ